MCMGVYFGMLTGISERSERIREMRKERQRWRERGTGRVCVGVSLPVFSAVGSLVCLQGQNERARDWERKREKDRERETKKEKGGGFCCCIYTSVCIYVCMCVCI